jgi:hypothetical protein
MDVERHVNWNAVISVTVFVVIIAIRIVVIFALVIATLAALEIAETDVVTIVV